MSSKLLTLSLLLLLIITCKDKSSDFVYSCILQTDAYQGGVTKYTFNEKDQLIKMDDYDSADLQNPYTFLFEYNSDGKVVLAKSTGSVNITEYHFTYKNNTLEFVKKYNGFGDTQYMQYHFFGDKISSVDQLAAGKVVNTWKAYWKDDNIIKVETLDSGTNKVTGYLEFLNYDSERNVKTSVINSSYIAITPKGFGDFSKNNYRKVTYDGNLNRVDSYNYEYTKDGGYISKSTLRNQFDQTFIHLFSWACKK